MTDEKPCSHCSEVHASDLACYRNKGRERKPAATEAWELDTEHGIAWNPNAHGAKRIAVWNGVTNALQVTCEGDWPDLPLPVLRALLSAHGYALVGA